MKRRHFLFMLAAGASYWPSRTFGFPLQSASAPPNTALTPESEPLYLLTYDHGGMVLWGQAEFIKYLRNAMQWLDRYPSFKIGLDNEAYTYDYLAEHEPQILQEIRDDLATHRGRFGIGTCTYGQPLAAFINEESNIRQISYAIAADRRHFAVTPSVYLMSEHAMHSQIPQLLAGFGFRGAIMRTHFQMYGYNPTFDAPIGWWIGVDGSRVPAIPTYSGEGAAFGKTTEDNWILTRYPGPECSEPLEQFKKKFDHLRPVLATRADDSGLRREDLVKQYEGNPGYRWILLEEIFPKFPKPVADFKTQPNDFTVRMPWGYCGNEIWNQSRRAETSVLTAERLAAIEALCGGKTHEPELEQSWKNLLVGQHHDVQICGLLDDARRFLSQSLKLSQEVQTSSLQALSAKMSGGNLGQVTVFNPLSWPSRQWIAAEVTLPAGIKALDVTQNGTPVDSLLQPIETHPDGSVQRAQLWLRADLPGLTLKSYAIRPATPHKAPESSKALSASVLETPYWRIHLDPQGGLASLEHLPSGRTMLQSKPRGGFFAALVDGKEEQSRGTCTLLPSPQGAPWQTVREEGTIGAIPYSLDMTLHQDSARIDFRATFHFDNQKIGRVSDVKRDAVSAFMHEEKLRFKLMPDFSGTPLGIRDLPFAVAETPDRYIEGNYWMALSDGNIGLAFLNRGTMGAVRELDGGFSLPLAHAMNYIWGTRMLKGDFTYEWALLPFVGPWQKADLHRSALSYNYPFVSHFSEAGTGKLGAELRPLNINSENVLMSALYPGKGKVYARFYESKGVAGSLHVGAASRQRQLVEVDLAGNVLGKQRSPYEFHGWQIRTFRLG